METEERLAKERPSCTSVKATGGSGCGVEQGTALPFYAKRNLKVEGILTEDGREFFCGDEGHPYCTSLKLNEIEHRTTSVVIADR